MSSKKYLKYVLPKVEPPSVDIRNPRNPKEGLGLRSFYDYAGVGCAPTLKPPPLRNIAPAEKLLQGETNATICLGVDRPSGRATGYGGKGVTGAGAVDICAGNMGGYERSHGSGPLYSDPSYVIDAARFTLSQKSDPDDNLLLPKGKVGTVTGLSSAVLKADAVRMVARDGGMKLVTGVDNRNSQTHKILKTPGIDLIAGGDDQGLQKMVLGENLVGALTEMQSDVDDLREAVTSFLKYQRGFNDKIISHNHHSPFFGLVGAPSINLIFEGIKAIFQLTAETETSLLFSGINNKMSKNSYFNPIAEKYILSALNHNN